MRPCIVILLLLAVATAITGFALGWFTFFTSPNEEITLNVDPETVPGWFHSSTSAKDQKTDITVTVEKMKKDRAEFQEHAELRFRAMDLGLDELKAKAKHGPCRHQGANEPGDR